MEFDCLYFFRQSGQLQLQSEPLCFLSLIAPLVNDAVFLTKLAVLSIANGQHHHNGMSLSYSHDFVAGGLLKVAMVEDLHTRCLGTYFCHSLSHRLHLELLESEGMHDTLPSGRV